MSDGQPITPERASLLLARAYGAERWEERDGWIWRSSPTNPRRRGNSALPVRADADPGLLATPDAPTLVQVEPLAERGALDAALAGCGWTVEAPSLVLVAPSAPLSRRPSAARVRRDAGGRLTVPGGEAVVANLDGGHVAVFALDVDPRHRRRGLATQLLAAAAAGAADGGAVVVQVEQANVDARALYAAAGFTELHRYHYRRAPFRGQGR